LQIQRYFVIGEAKERSEFPKKEAIRGQSEKYLKKGIKKQILLEETKNIHLSGKRHCE
jgi:hypothetical protein